ncbi:MAG: WYL domain-containing protein [Burkholderiaceae bacterium]|nr:WYL domain-containing protein [Burkholderiaceae bacterium]
MRQSPVPPLSGQSSATSWGQGRRLEFIDFRLRWEQRLNRADLTSFFGISTPQASIDIAKYAEMAPANLVYDRSAKVYVAGSAFAPLFPSTSSPSRFLNELLATEVGVLAPESSLVGWRPSLAVAPSPGRALDATILAGLLSAIREGAGVRVLYQSMSRTEPLWRGITPHALANDGFRWHVRAYCHERAAFRDFVIARVLELEPTEASGPGAEADADWGTEVELVLVPHPKLAKAKRRAIELDYGMRDGEARLTCRKALLFYVLRHLGLDRADTDSPEAAQVVLKNRKALEQHLPAAA